MSSQYDDHQKKRDQSDHRSSYTSLDANINHQSTSTPPPSQPPQNQWPPHGHPPATGYPPQMMYPNAPYPGYPPPPPPPHHHHPPHPPPPHAYNQHPYAQPPPAPYYSQGYVAAPHQDRCSGFARGIIAAMIILIAISCLSSLITWVILLPKSPVFHVDKMSVSNFNTSANPFTATWDANLTVENPNHKLRFYFDKIAGAMFYDDEDYSLGSTWINPMFMETKTKTTMQAVISANGSAENAVPIWVAQEMGKDRMKGSVTFALRFRVWATFKSGSWWTRSFLIRVLCEDLKVNFVGDSRNGTLAPGKLDCEVYT